MDAEKKGPRGPQYRNHVDGYRIAKKKRRFWGPTKKKEAKKVSANQWGGTTLCALLFVFFCVFVCYFSLKGQRFVVFSSLFPFFLPSFTEFCSHPSLTGPFDTHTRKMDRKWGAKGGRVSPSFPDLGPLFFFFGASSNWIGSVTHRGGFDFTAFYLVLLRFNGFCMTFIGFYWVLLGFTRFHLVLLGFNGFYWVLLGFT